MILGREAQALGRKEKWDLLSPFLRANGREALSYATLQEGMEYFIDEVGYIAFTSVDHPVFARKTKRIVLSDPVCAQKDCLQIIRNFLAVNPRSVFAVISEHCAQVLRSLNFKANCIGIEPEIPIQTYNTKGNWKELDLIKRARNEVKREGIVILEDNIETLNKHDLSSISAKWIGTKKVNDREIWIYARRPIFEHEEDVRKFVAYDKGGQVAGFVFYDPMYREGDVVGYSANISRCDEQRFGKLATAINMVAAEKFKEEGKEVLNLCLAPFVKLDGGKFNDDWATRIFFELSERYGNEIYNFKGLSFHKSKYRVPEKHLYFASNSLMPANDVYLAFLSSDITRSYFSTVGRLLRGMCAAAIKRKPNRLAVNQVRTPKGEKEEL
ncbi:MAG: phosphatidylglycerol lysyltransferase domain-containing protein [Verrucomicrobiota bacterium]